MRSYNFSTKLYGYNTLIEIFDILDDKIEIIDKVLILPDNYEELIGDRQLKLTKKFYSYKNDLFRSAMTKQKYLEIEEKNKLELIKEQKRKELEEIKKQEDINKINEYKKEYGNKWRDKEWINKNIGEYYNFEPCMEYYWTIIEDNYKFTKGGNIILENNIYNYIKNDTKFNIKGNIFLGRSFKKYGSKRILSGETYFLEEIVKSCGVYGIYVNNELIYIGSTMRNFETRFKEHLDNINGIKHDGLYVYNLINREDKIEFKKIVDIMLLNTNIPINRKDVESMELALINTFHPRGNLADGVLYQFKYREDK